jgi:glycosyltransferase involved in cell wall biosynthesis
MNGNLDLSVTICALNEEKNIAQCIQAVKSERPSEIILVDGGSDDNTCQIAKELGVEVFNVGRKGLIHQRKISIEKAKYNYIAIIDADQQPVPGCFFTLIGELEKYKYDGIGGQRISVCNKGYWDWGTEQNCRLTLNIPGPRIMIGPPCIYKAKVLKEIYPTPLPLFTGPDEDTETSYRAIKAGYKLGMGTGVVKEENRSTFSAFRKKLIWYGKGDAHFAWHNPERLLSILKQELFNYPIKKSFIALRHKEPKLIPFFVFYGMLRHYGFLLEIIKILAGKRVDRDIYGT